MALVKRYYSENFDSMKTIRGTYFNPALDEPEDGDKFEITTYE